MKVLTATLLTGFAMAMLAGCTANTPQGVSTETNVIVVEVGDRKVPCVVWDGYKAGGISCDWSVK